MDTKLKQFRYGLIGFIGAAAAQIVYFKWRPYIEVGWALFLMPIYFGLSLPLGLLTGYLFYQIEELVNRRYNFFILTFILSTANCFLFLTILHDNFNLPW